MFVSVANLSPFKTGCKHQTWGDRLLAFCDRNVVPLFSDAGLLLLTSSGPVWCRRLCLKDAPVKSELVPLTAGFTFSSLMVPFQIILNKLWPREDGSMFTECSLLRMRLPDHYWPAIKLVMWGSTSSPCAETVLNAGHGAPPLPPCTEKQVTIKLWLG